MDIKGLIDLIDASKELKHSATQLAEAQKMQNDFIATNSKYAHLEDYQKKLNELKKGTQDNKNKQDNLSIKAHKLKIYVAQILEEQRELILKHDHVTYRVFIDDSGLGSYIQYVDN